MSITPSSFNTSLNFPSRRSFFSLLATTLDGFVNFVNVMGTLDKSSGIKGRFSNVLRSSLKWSRKYVHKDSSQRFGGWFKSLPGNHWTMCPLNQSEGNDFLSRAGISSLQRRRSWVHPVNKVTTWNLVLGEGTQFLWDSWRAKNFPWRNLFEITSLTWSKEKYWKSLAAFLAKSYDRILRIPTLIQNLWFDLNHPWQWSKSYDKTNQVNVISHIGPRQI